MYLYSGKFYFNLFSLCDLLFASHNTGLTSKSNLENGSSDGYFDMYLFQRMLDKFYHGNHVDRLCICASVVINVESFWKF